MGYLEIAGLLNVHSPSHAAERERKTGSMYRRGSFLTQPMRVNRGNSEVGKEGRSDRRSDQKKNRERRVVMKREQSRERDEGEGWIREKLKGGEHRESEGGKEWRRARKRR